MNKNFYSDSETNSDYSNSNSLENRLSSFGSTTSTSSTSSSTTRLSLTLSDSESISPSTRTSSESSSSSELIQKKNFPTNFGESIEERKLLEQQKAQKTKKKKKQIKRPGNFPRLPKPRNRIKVTETEVEKKKDEYGDTEESFTSDEGSNEIDHYFEKNKKLEDRKKKIRKGVLEDKSIDLCFLFDTTISMKYHIRKCKKEAINIINKLRSDYPEHLFNFAFVGYQDYQSKTNMSTTYQVLSFVPFDRYQEFKTFLANVEVKGNNDDAEDVAGGLKKMLELKWKSTLQIVVHFADSPAHGKKYHAGFITDRFLEGDPKQIKITDLLIEMKQKGIHYYFAKITNRTDKMILEFKKTYDVLNTGFYLQTINNQDRSIKITNLVLQLLSQSLDYLQTISSSNPLTLPNNNIRSTNDQNESEYQDDEDIWAQYEIYDFMTPSSNLDYKTILGGQETQYVHSYPSVSLCKKMFKKGKRKYCFQLHDNRYGVCLIGKRFILPPVDKKFQYLNELNQRHICKQFVIKFNCKNPLYYLDVLDLFTIYHSQMKDYTNVEPFFEPCLKKGLTTNSQRFENRLLSQAFSHYSWIKSNNRILIVPKIISNHIIVKVKIYSTNSNAFGENGGSQKVINEFCNNHVCNELCKHLNFLPFNNKKSNLQNHKSVLKKTITHQKLLCSNPYCVNFVKLLPKNYNSKYINYCDDCKILLKEF
ncbi:alpha-protein kinase vwka [Anaeramoeba flamelloides]|uniref:Alpha-protein kinase vwka n=1 Tax=Anaeramoeba flamelloides TaxID=1746091 RepID=A0ABQ8XK26_9EUKA|nr:alpha-protein kinase vwka [Anaeramoeba flamelloides]